AEGKVRMRIGFVATLLVTLAACHCWAQSNEVIPGHIISKAEPKYPLSAKMAHLEGEVVINAKIGKDGHVIDPTAVSGPPLLQKTAVDAVKDWVYTPYMRGGEPVEVETTYTISFKVTEKLPKGRLFVPGPVMQGNLITTVQPQYPQDQITEHRSAE